MARLRNLSLLFLFSGFFLLPVFNLFSVWPLNSAILSGLSFFFVALLAITVQLVSSQGFKVSPPIYFFTGIMVVLIVSSYFGDYGYNASWKWYLVVIFLCLVLIFSSNELRSSKDFFLNDLICRGLWSAGSFVSFVSLLKYYGIVSIFFPWLEPSSGRLLGVWNQPNLTTTFSWLVVLAGCVWFSKANSKVWYYAFLIVSGWVIACAASRMSWLILAGMFALAIVSRLRWFQTQESKEASNLLLISLVILSVMLVVVPKFNEPVREALVSIDLLESSSSVSLLDRNITQDSARLTELKKVFSSLDEYSVPDLLIGVGPGNYPQFSYQADMNLSPGNISSGVWLHSHNLFTMVFVEFGAAGLALLLIFILTILRVVIRSRFDLRVFFSVGALGIIFVHSNLEYPLWYPWFLFFLCLILSNLFEVKEVVGQSSYLKPAVVGVIFLAIIFLLVNVGYQYKKIVVVSLESNPVEEDYRSLSLLANDDLIGPYSVLRRYYEFSPEPKNIDWQLKEVQKMKQWQPRDLVLMREYLLLLMKGNLEAACQAAESTAYRYPQSAPIMLEHAVKSVILTPLQVIRMAECIENGLEPRGETIPSIEAKNRQKLSRM